MSDPSGYSPSSSQIQRGKACTNCRNATLFGQLATNETPTQMLGTIRRLKERIDELELLVAPDPSRVYLSHPYIAPDQPTEPPTHVIAQLVNVFLERFVGSAYFFINHVQFRRSALLPFPFGHRNRPSPALLSATYLWGTVLAAFTPSDPYTPEAFLHFWVAADGCASTIPPEINVDIPWPSSSQCGATILRFLNGNDIQTSSPLALLAKSAILLERIIAFCARTVGSLDLATFSSLNRRLIAFQISLPPLPGGPTLVLTHALADLAILRLNAPHSRTSDTARNKAQAAAVRIATAVEGANLNHAAHNADPMFAPICATVASFWISELLYLYGVSGKGNYRIQTEARDLEMRLQRLIDVAGALAASPIAGGKTPRLVLSDHSDASLQSTAFLKLCHLIIEHTPSHLATSGDEFAFRHAIRGKGYFASHLPNSSSGQFQPPRRAHGNRNPRASGAAHFRPVNSPWSAMTSGSNLEERSRANDIIILQAVPEDALENMDFSQDMTAPVVVETIQWALQESRLYLSWIRLDSPLGSRTAIPF
ncbi:hypothetical protein C8R44DRAFT_741552 [Mycena epipterygia]|nr:hypothetical protein C8R44DRAFT_741552 [Mycena epipterygia]